MGSPVQCWNTLFLFVNKLKKLRDERLNKKVSLSTFDLELQMGVKAKRKLD